jgi:hypothetical protein
MYDGGLNVNFGSLMVGSQKGSGNLGTSAFSDCICNITSKVI